MTTFLLLMWNLVTLQCDGTPETMFRHEVRYNIARVIGSQPCDPGEPLGAQCQLYTVFGWEGPYYTAQPRFQTSEVDIGVGEVLTYEVTSVDVAGNRDCGVVTQ